jgi:hypothetical protein
MLSDTQFDRNHQRLMDAKRDNPGLAQWPEQRLRMLEGMALRMAPIEAKLVEVAEVVEHAFEIDTEGI